MLIPSALATGLILASPLFYLQLFSINYYEKCGGGGLVTQSCLTLETPWTVA